MQYSQWTKEHDSTVRYSKHEKRTNLVWLCMYEWWDREEDRILLVYCAVPYKLLCDSRELNCNGVGRELDFHKIRTIPLTTSVYVFCDCSLYIHYSTHEPKLFVSSFHRFACVCMCVCTLNSHIVCCATIAVKMVGRNGIIKIKMKIKLRNVYYFQCLAICAYVWVTFYCFFRFATTVQLYFCK